MNKIEISIDKKINESIPYWYKEVRIVGENIESKIVSLNEAKSLAKSMDLDLIELNSQSNPPILKIANYEKMLYEAKKNAKKNAKNKHELKEIQLSASIALHDIETKVKKAKEFIEKGNNVRILLTLKGRERSRKEENKKSLYQFIDLMSDIASPMSMPIEIGNRFSVILKKK